MRALTIRQPWADLILYGGKDVENRTWPVPSTLPQWGRCRGCGKRFEPGAWKGKGRHNCRPGKDVVQALLSSGEVLPDGPFPFTIAIHAAKNPGSSTGKIAVLNHAAEALTDHGLATNLLPTPNGRTSLVDYRPRALGAFVGLIDVTGCHRWPECPGDEATCTDPDGHCKHWYDVDAPCCRCGAPGPCSQWADVWDDDVFHWTLANPRPLEAPIPATGRLGLWILTDEQEAAVEQTTERQAA